MKKIQFLLSSYGAISKPVLKNWHNERSIIPLAVFFSDWLIFKKIEKLDYTFQDGFDREAESLIRQLLVIDPDARLGAKNRKRYDTVRQHPFFQGKF